MTPQQKSRFERLVEEGKRLVSEWSYETRNYKSGEVSTSFWMFNDDGEILMYIYVYTSESLENANNDALDAFESKLYAYQECLSGQQRDKEIALMGEEL